MKVETNIMLGWYVVALILGGSIIWLGNRRTKDWLAIHKERQAVAIQEQKTQAELAASTQAERTEFEKAELRRRTAQARATTLVAEDPAVLGALRREKLDVIAARAQGRVAAVRERGTGGDDLALLDALLEAHGSYVKKRSVTISFDEWLDGFDPTSISLEALEKLLAAYKSYVSARSISITFGRWMRGTTSLDLRRF